MRAPLKQQVEHAALGARLEHHHRVHGLQEGVLERDGAAGRLVHLRAQFLGKSIAERLQIQSIISLSLEAH